MSPAPKVAEDAFVVSYRDLADPDYDDKYFLAGYRNTQLEAKELADRVARAIDYARVIVTRRTTGVTVYYRTEGRLLDPRD